MKKNPSSAPIRFRLGAVVLAGLGLFLLQSPLRGAEPMLDIGVYELSRLEAFNLARDGSFQEAVQAEKRVLKIAEDQYGPLHPELASIYKDLGLLYHSQGEFKKAEEAAKWGLALVEKNGGLDHPTTADYLDQLAFLYTDLNRLEEAEIDAKRSLAIRKAGPKGNNQALIQTLDLLGWIESRLQKNDQAQRFLTEALGLLEKESHLEGLSIHLLGALARSYQSDKNPTKAQSSLEKALSLAQKSFHADSPEVADAMESLADFYNSQNQGDKAKPFYTSAVEIDRHYVGTVFTYQSLPFLRRLAQADFSVGELKASENLWQKSLQVEKEVFGPQHPKVALDLIHLAEAQSALNLKAKSQASLKEALGILKSRFPADNPLVLLVQKRLE